MAATAATFLHSPLYCRPILHYPPPSSSGLARPAWSGKEARSWKHQHICTSFSPLCVFSFPLLLFISFFAPRKSSLSLSLCSSLEKFRDCFTNKIAPPLLSSPRPGRQGHFSKCQNEGLKAGAPSSNRRREREERSG